MSDPEYNDGQGGFSGRWLVQVLGEPDSESFELSIVREDFEHGRRSWGWFGRAKWFFCNQGPHMRMKLAPGAWARIMAAAEETAADLNATQSPEPRT